MNNAVGNSSSTISFVANLSIFSIAFGFGILRVIQGQLLVGQFIAIVQIANYLINPLLLIMNAINDKKTTKPIIDLIDTFKEDSRESISTLDFDSIEITNGSVSTIDNLLFSHLDLTIKKGDNILIMAPSGYGKTTLLRILSGFGHFSEGQYLINGLNVQDKNIKTLFSIINQNPFIFDRSILFNLTLGQDFSELEITNVLEQSELSEFIKEKGLDYQVGENGKNLSGGQKQRLAIARALLSNREVIIADEVTSALDKETSTKISEMLLLNHQTLIEVSHKTTPEQMSNYTKVIYLDKLED